MAQKYTLDTSATNYLRLAAEPVQLSDGTLVFLHHTNAAGTAPVLAWTSDRATINAIATLPVGTTSTTFYAATGVGYYALAVDSADNIFVIGTLGSSSLALPAVQAYLKGTGRTWTAQTVVGATTGGPGSISGYTATWCNTGGGLSAKGHILICSAVMQYFWTFDAGKLLSGGGTGTFVGSTGASIAMSRSGTHGGSPLSPDGFGAANGLIATPGNGSNSVYIGKWSVDAAGTVTQTAVGTAFTVTGSIGIDFRVCLVRYAAGSWVVLAPASVSSGGYYAARLGSAGTVTASAASGTITSLPPYSAAYTYGFSAFLDPATANRVWLIAIPNDTSGQIRRASIDLGSGVTWATTATLDDTMSPYGSPFSGQDISAVRQPVGTNVDYLLDASVGSSYALLGDYAAFNQAPNAPTLTGPASGATIDRTITQRFTWTFSDPDTGDSQSAFDVRYRAVGASTWITVSGTTTNQYLDFASGTFAAGSYEWQVRTYDSQGAPSSWSASSFFTAATPPAAVTITAPTSGGTISAGTFDVTWSAPSQTDYQVRVVKDTAGSADTSTIYSDTNDVVDATSRVRTMPFPNNGIYVHVQVRIKAGGLWSSWTDVRVLVSYTPPATPTLAITTAQLNGRDAGFLITPTHPTPSGGQPAVVSIDIYRRKVADGGSGQRYATGLAPSSPWADYRVAAATPYAWLVRAFAANGTYTDSAWTA